MTNSLAQKVGRMGEEIVLNLLEGAKYSDPLEGNANYYDILWNDIKIEVKTSTFQLRNGFQLTGRASQTGGKDVVYVFVGIDKDENKYFWVMNPPKVASIYAKFTDCVDEKALPNVIRDLWNKEKENEK